MKSEQRHELQKNELADGLVRAAEWSRVNTPLLLGVVAGAAVVVGGYLYFHNASLENAAGQWNTFFSAAGTQDAPQLESLSVRESGTPAGQMANLLLADTALSNGIDLMSTDRSAAEIKLNDAKNRYSKVRQEAADPLLNERAVLGLARYYETLGLLDEAVKEYTTLKTSWPNGPYADMAGRKIEYLSAASTKAFANWYREHKPLPPAPMGTGSFPGLGDLKLPTDEKSFPGGGTAAP
jgi:predicted negative regulator of RcsB-dependent stress response